MTNFNDYVKNIIEANPMVFGASAAPSANQLVKFAYADDLSKVANAPEGALVYVDLNGTGAVYAGNALVSSKILDVVYTENTSVGDQVTVTYIDSNDTQQTTTFGVIDKTEVETLIAELKTAVDSSIAYLDSSVSSLFETIETLEGGDLYFTSSAADDTATLAGHGMLDKGITIGELKTMTLSEILQKILFETAAPQQRTARAFNITLASPYNTYVDVSTAYPTVSNITATHTNETWYWVSSTDSTVSGGVTTTSAYSSAVYYYNSTNSTSGGTDMSTEAYTGAGLVTKDGTNGYFYAIGTFVAGSDAVDSAGSTTDSTGATYHAANAATVTSSVRTYTGSYRYFSNANKISASSQWSNRNTEPGTAFAGNDTQTNSGLFCRQYTTIYAQWVSGSIKTSTDYLYFYVPNTMKISNVYTANPTASNTYDVALSFTLEDTVEIDAGHTTFKKYKLEWSATGICTARITCANA